MDLSTLPRHARTPEPGWARPYASGLFSPVFYIGGASDDGTEDDDQDNDAGNGDDDPDDDAGDDNDGKEPEGQGEGDDDQDDDADPEGADALGDKGKRALASMKGKYRSERDKRKALEQQLAEKDAGDEQAKAQREIESQALAKANGRILRSEVKAAAKGVLNDPKDAFLYLDLDQFEVDDDGNVDSEEIADAIEELIKSKPYLGAAKAPRFQGGGDGGAARKASRPKQLKETDLKNMSSEQIVKAQDAGQLDDLLGTG